MNLLDVREKLAAVLAPVEHSDPSVLVSLVDAIEPPALMLGWDEPWATPDTTAGQVVFVGHLAVMAVASRLMPGEGIGHLEELVAFVLARLATDPASWQWAQVSGPRVFTIAKTNYLAARIQVRTQLQVPPRATPSIVNYQRVTI
jgi:hypothetical protein